MRIALIALIACAAACSPPAQPPAADSAASAPLNAVGAASALLPSDVSDDVDGAVSVVKIDNLANEANAGIKMFGTAGGDPAMNGLYTYIAFFVSPAEGWRVFQLGDFLDYRIVSEAPGRVDLELHESLLDDATGEISSHMRYVIVSWTRDADQSPPASLTITAAAAP